MGPLSGDRADQYYREGANDREKGVVIGIESDQSNSGELVMRYIVVFLSALIWASCGQQSANSVGNTGKSGSLARFAQGVDRLYTISEGEISVFDTTFPDSLNLLEQYQSGVNDSETLFYLDETLYVGAETGMHIFNIEENDQITRMGSHRHFRACDPVVVDGNTAFVTQDSSGGCGNGISQLEVVDVSIPYAPKQIDSISLKAPRGLGFTEDKLFVCDMELGLQIFDRTNSIELTGQTSIPWLQCHDIILETDRAIIVSQLGIYQFALVGDDPDLLSLVHAATE